MIKFMFVLIIVFCFGYIGYGIGNYYRNRYKFFSECEEFCNSLAIKINFSKDILKEIINKQIEESKTELKNVLKIYLEKYEIQEIDVCYLNKDEKTIVKNFLNDLGKFDSENQLIQIGECKKEYEKLIEKSLKEKNKYASLYLKLFILVGLVISILII